MNAMREQICVMQTQTALTPMEVMNAYVTQDMKDLELNAIVSCVCTIKRFISS